SRSQRSRQWPRRGRGRSGCGRPCSLRRRGEPKCGGAQPASRIGANAIDLGNPGAIGFLALDTLALLLELIALLGAVDEMVLQGVRIQRERIREKPFVLTQVVKRG